MIRLIAAIDRQRGIAKHGFQPWNIPDDESYFQASTMSRGGIVLMGRATYEVVGRPLAGRTNIVITSRSDMKISGVQVISDLEHYLADIRDGGDLWIIGGASVYEQSLRYADELYLTLIDADFGCDKFFPDWAGLFAQRSLTESHEQNGFSYAYSVWHRK